MLQPSGLGLRREALSGHQLSHVPASASGWGQWGDLTGPSPDATPHLRGSKDKGRDDGWNPAIAKVKDDEPGNALHDDDVGQQDEEEQVVALEQVHVLGRLPQGPEVLGDLGLGNKSTGEVSATRLRWRGPTSSCRGKWWPRGAPHRPVTRGSPATVHHAQALCPGLPGAVHHVFGPSQVGGRERLRLESWYFAHHVHSGVTATAHSTSKPRTHPWTPGRPGRGLSARPSPIQPLRRRRARRPLPQGWTSQTSRSVTLSRT